MNHSETNHIESRLKELGFNLPAPLPSAGDYVGFVKTTLSDGSALITISGQVPLKDGKLVRGKVGKDITEADAVGAAELCALALLAQLKLACDGDLNKVQRCVRLGGFVNAVDDFTNHPEVINGASKLLVSIFGEKGKHARFAVGVSSLPRNVAVEIEAQFQIEL